MINWIGGEYPAPDKRGQVTSGEWLEAVENASGQHVHLVLFYGILEDPNETTERGYFLKFESVPECHKCWIPEYR